MTELEKFYDEFFDNQDLTWRKITDWNDYYTVIEKELPFELDFETGIRRRHVIVYYYKRETPFPGDGTFGTTDPTIVQETEDEWLSRNVFHRFDSSVVVEKIINLNDEQ